MTARMILIAGPTASGKSSLALKLAEKLNGEIINADSMQVYEDLRVLTARPNLADCAAAPHHLYGTVDGASDYSVQHWLDQVKAVLSEIAARGRLAVIVGGTGLYFSALVDGLSPVPPIREDIRARWRAAQRDIPSSDLHDQLSALDPKAASQINRGDTQRLVRALEVFDSTGTSIVDWQQQARAGAICAVSGSAAITLLPDRAWLHKRIDDRFVQMMDQGAVAEVGRLLERNMDPSKPVMKAIGVPQISAYLEGRQDRAGAIEAAAARSRQYAKRQYTWMRNQLQSGWTTASDAEQAYDIVLRAVS
jgi:tRNA dimethylallyltransferase